MAIDQDVILKQIDIALGLIKQARAKLLGQNPPHLKRGNKVYFSELSQTEIANLCTRIFATIERVAPRNSRHLKNARALFGQGLLNPYAIERAEGILLALRDDYTDGYLRTIEELIHAEMFSDFLDMAEYFLQSGYKDPAAVISGSVLEDHLRKLCVKAGIDTTQPNAKGTQPKKADTMNADLARDEIVYTKVDQKAVTSWLALRNAAAHGQYNEYTSEQIVLMTQGIRGFLLKYPA